MQFKFTKKFGDTEVVFQDVAESPQDFFKKVSFYSSLPSTGPNGEMDLQVTHRNTKDGFVYFSLVSKSAKKEFQLGQVNDDSGNLFPKGWVDSYEKGRETPTTTKTPEPAMTTPPREDATTTTKVGSVMDEYL